jgi:hypothetical protein
MYENLQYLDPENLREQFINVKDFERYLKTQNYKDLEIILANFETEELYRDCIIIKKILDETLFNYYYPVYRN